MKFLNLKKPKDFKQWEIVINSGGARNNDLGQCNYEVEDQCQCHKYESDNEDNECNFLHIVGFKSFCELQIKGAV